MKDLSVLEESDVPECKLFRSFVGCFGDFEVFARPARKEEGSDDELRNGSFCF